MKKLVYFKPKKLEVPDEFDTWPEEEQTAYLQDLTGTLENIEYDTFFNMRKDAE